MEVVLILIPPLIYQTEEIYRFRNKDLGILQTKRSKIINKVKVVLRMRNMMILAVIIDYIKFIS